MEGVMMRNGPVYALAVRASDGDIVVERRRLYTLGGGAVSGKPFVLSLIHICGFATTTFHNDSSKGAPRLP